ncbi:23S rRNA (pseudouridine1915-N3)-methyltransferase [Salibacterium salarium]|uniref:Ribosomal RNA large subunit methyltransferase H n=1 Tax=Salibacterium salarium TaxID=284579 RepID=A0A3R9PY30_9BACI|nr:23S rRNA (pseudouridine(1915)-N(3))-methyltransferase RlmH [Salibacterium salarium]MDQ0297659.1 23S rRNA (pseudouridine1915-N3)-methyltransferase [Salibacterium salarium]RSL29530.1 23S rRNA (pseudouridine(1915)-N(3))-methyltransferase RlmH [Salibacterium salarium]
MQIQIISVGKIKEKYINQGIAEFEKRLRPYCKLSMEEVNDEQAPEQMSEKEMAQVKQKEGERILNKIKATQYVFALDIKGENWSSEKLAGEMEKLSIYGNSQVTFIIGGSNGLSDDVLKRANQKLSFSKMTFPHQLMKLILMEQIYRTFKIQKNEPYHK